MRVIYFDIDTLRPDHLGCYGYHRNTSPNIDWIASQGARMEECFTPDAPCLPSRSSLFQGRFGIKHGAIGHGGTAADLRREGQPRAFKTDRDLRAWPAVMRETGLRTVSISPFAERHSAWHFYQGFSEMYNPGKSGQERADEVTPIALDWIERNAEEDDWFLHINMWDPHTPYRTPEEFGNPFQEEPVGDWITEEKISRDYNSYGPHSARDVHGWGGPPPIEGLPEEIASLADYKRWIDGYDTGIRYADEHVGKVMNALEEKGLLEDTIIIVSSDHGENQGELNVYGDHQTADYITNRVPLIIRWPGKIRSGLVDECFHYNFDMAATFLDLLGGEIPSGWDGRSFASSLKGGDPEGRDYLVVSQGAWSCQRAVRFDSYILVRTYHDGFKDFPEVMLFDVEEDPHELEDLSDRKPDAVRKGLGLLELWHGKTMEESRYPTDPMWQVMKEGGPFHVRGNLKSYCERLRETGREEAAEKLQREFGD